MKYHLVSGGCGFVGRNLARRLLKTTADRILVADDLSVGLHPSRWLDLPQTGKIKDIILYGKEERFLFYKGDFRVLLRQMLSKKDFLQKRYGFDFERFSDVYHFAAIVGGRAKIEGDPMMVALDLSIDAEFFFWVVNHRPARVLYPSSSAAYPIGMQTEGDAVALRESDIRFGGNLGQPDMTYGWSKLTGEYLAQIAARHYHIPTACVRPFSGYGEDQDLTYPIPALAARAARREDPFTVWGTGKQGRDFVHIDDCIDCILLAMERIRDGSAINIGSGKLTTFLEIIDLFCQFAGYKPVIKPLADKPMGVHSRYANMDLSLKQFGWKPKIPLEEGMRRVYERMKSAIPAR